MPIWGPVAVLLVDDGSGDPPPERLDWSSQHLASIEVLRLRRNLGHQRAIAVGLSFIHAERPCRAVLFMDGDGEDAPQDVSKLVETCAKTGWRRAVFAKRSRRTEGIGFKLGYFGYKILHRMLTGHAIEVGNFSVIPERMVERLVGVAE